MRTLVWDPGQSGKPPFSKAEVPSSQVSGQGAQCPAGGPKWTVTTQMAQHGHKLTQSEWPSGQGRLLDPQVARRWTGGPW